MQSSRAILSAIVFTISLAAPAQAPLPARTALIGYITQRAGPSEFEEAFVNGLRDLGYVDGKNIAIEYRWGGGKQTDSRRLRPTWFDSMST